MECLKKKEEEEEEKSILFRLAGLLNLKLI